MILLQDKEFRFVENNLPMLIHGEEGSGASLYTINVAANFYKQGLKILFLCGFHKAEQEFKSQVGNLEAPGALINFCTKDKLDAFKEQITRNVYTDNKVVIIKNIEFFDNDILDLVSENEQLIVSGNLNQSKFKNKLLDKAFNTKIFFSSISGIDLPKLGKYEGFLTSKNLQGITKLAL